MLARTSPRNTTRLITRYTPRMPSDAPVAIDAASASRMNALSNIAIALPANHQCPLPRDPSQVDRNSVNIAQALLLKHLVHGSVQDPLGTHDHDRGCEVEHDWQHVRHQC